jgi:chromate transporter
MALASALRTHPSLIPELHGLSVVAMAVVAQAVLLLGRKLVRNWSAGFAAAGALFLFLILNSAYTALLVITAAGFFGIALRVHAPELPSVPVRLSPRVGAICLALFLALLVFFSVLAKFSDNLYIQTFDVFYRTGSLVFGGGHVVLPLLETEIVGRGWMNREGFLSGYGAAQAMPGPLFAFAGYVGSSMLGIGGGIVAIVGIFLPGFLLVVGSLSWWNRIQKNRSLRSALAMIGASAVGILGAALVILLNSALRTQFDLILAIILLAMLLTEKIPAWVVTVAGLCAWKAWTVL